VSKNWRQDDTRCTVDVILLNAIISIFGVVTDLYLLLPVPVVLRLQTSTKRRGKFPFRPASSQLLFPPFALLQK
jgi:hypothetical protein